MKIIATLESLIEEQPTQGYRAVIIALLARFNLEIHHNEKALEYLKEYKELESDIEGNIADLPEVIASKAFALAFCNPKSSGEVISFYGLALEEREEVDWLYGQCLAMEKELRLPGKDDDSTIRNLEKKLRN